MSVWPVRERRRRLPSGSSNDELRLVDEPVVVLDLAPRRRAAPGRPAAPASLTVRNGARSVPSERPRALDAARGRVGRDDHRVPGSSSSGKTRRVRVGDQPPRLARAEVAERERLDRLARDDRVVVRRRPGSGGGDRPRRDRRVPDAGRVGLERRRRQRRGSVSAGRAGISRNAPTIGRVGEEVVADPGAAVALGDVDQALDGADRAGRSRTSAP